MASVSKDGKGWRIQFEAPDRARKTLRLGPVDKKTAESIRGHVEALLVAKTAGVPVRQETAVWLANVGETLRDRLARAGLVDAKPTSAVPTLQEFLGAYLERRRDAKPSTHVHWKEAVRSLITFFDADRRLDSITAGDAQDFARWLRTPDARTMRYAEHGRHAPLSPNTIGKRIGDSKQFFADAVDRGLIPQNPFAKLSGNAGCNRARDYFVARDVALRVLEACPNAEWRAIFALARWGALRVPSELVSLTWGDVDWERGRLRVPSPKTEHHAGRGQRVIPLFPELRQALSELWDVTPPGTVHIFRLQSSVNLRTQFQRILHRAGIQPWPKLWQNLRASRATELAREYPQHVAAAWCGHTVHIADRHYWQVTDADYEKATTEHSDGGVKSDAQGAKKPTVNVSAWRGKPEKFASETLTECDVVPRLTCRNSLVHKDLVGGPRLELGTSTV